MILELCRLRVSSWEEHIYDSNRFVRGRRRSPIKKAETAVPPSQGMVIKHLGPDVRAQVTSVFTQALQKTNLNSDAVQATLRALQDVLPNLVTVATSGIFDVLTEGPTASAANCSGGI